MSGGEGGVGGGEGEDGVKLPLSGQVRSGLVALAVLVSVLDGGTVTVSVPGMVGGERERAHGVACHLPEVSM